MLAKSLRVLIFAMGLTTNAVVAAGVPMQKTDRSNADESTKPEPKRAPISEDPGGSIDASNPDADFYAGLGAHGDEPMGQARGKASAKKPVCVYKPTMTDAEIQNCRSGK